MELSEIRKTLEEIRRYEEEGIILLGDSRITITALSSVLEILERIELNKLREVIAKGGIHGILGMQIAKGIIRFLKTGSMEYDKCPL